MGELVRIKLAGEVCNALLEARLRVGDGLIVDGRANFFEDEVEHEAGGEVAYGFRHVLVTVAPERRNGIGSCCFVEFQIHSGAFSARLNSAETFILESVIETRLNFSGGFSPAYISVASFCCRADLHDCVWLCHCFCCYTAAQRSGAGGGVAEFSSAAVAAATGG